MGPGRTVELRLSGLVLPDRCIACAERAERRSEVVFRRGIDLLVVSFMRTTSIEVPVCRRCRARWWRRYALIGTGLVGAIVLLIGLYGLLLDPAYGEAGMLALVPAVLVILIWGRQRIDGWADRSIFGVRILDYDWESGLGRIWFRDELLADALAQGRVEGVGVEHQEGREIGVGHVGIDVGAAASSARELDAGRATGLPKADLVWLNRKTGKGYRLCREALAQAEGDLMLAAQMLMDEADLARERSALISREIVESTLQGAPSQAEWELVDGAQDLKDADAALRRWSDEDEEA
ncbi:MAG: hypothetical protein JXR96_25000 [Deltaproteobacteria bacterium]|nr:hypothetical protein [Deltaproteobacteria bacterium]